MSFFPFINRTVFNLHQQDPLAAQVYKILTKKEDIPVESLDQGVALVDYSNPRFPSFSWKGRGDGQSSPPEVFRKALEHISLDSFESPYLIKLVDKLGFIPPWVFTDLNPQTSEDKECYKKLKGIVEGVQLQMKLRKFDSQYVHDTAWALVEEVKKKWSLVYDPKTPTAPHAVGMLHKQKKNCLEIVCLFYTLFSLAGLHPQIIELEFDEKGNSVNHLALALSVDPSDPDKILLFDYGNNGYLGKPYSDKIWHPIGLNDLVSEFFINQYYAKPYASPREKEALLLKAYQFSPDRFRCSYHLAQFYKEQNRPQETEHFLQLARDVSHYPGLTGQ